MPGNGIVAPSFRRDWRRLLLFALAAYAAAFCVRYLDLPKWDNDLLRVNGEYILATHDAYCWVAGAKGVGTGCGTPLAKLAAFVSETTGLSLGLVAFWAPAVIASLVAVVLVLWAWTLGGLEAGLCAGMVGALAPGFFFRTRLGYYDTDIVTLLFPLVQSWVLAHWLSPWLSSPVAFFRKRKDPGPDSSRMPGLEWAFLAGLVVRYGGAGWHTNILDFNAVVFCAAIFLALALGRGQVRPRLLWGLGVYALAAFFGLLGLAAALGVTVFSRLAPRKFGQAAGKLIPALVLIALVFFSTGPVYKVYTKALDQFRMYSKSVTEVVRGRDALKTPANTTDAPVQKPVYPGITQSVVEAQNLPLTEILDKLYVKVWVAVAGLAGFLVVIVFRPAALFLLPLAALSFTGVKLGARMSMFGGPAVALGLSLPLCWLTLWLIGKRPWRRLAVTVLQALLGFALLWPLLDVYRPLGPTPILYKVHCQALQELEKISPPNSQVWTWWDWGYATMYYSGRMSFADGARHSGEYLYPLGLALTTPNPLQANQLLKYGALQNNQPWTIWDKRPAKEVQSFLHLLGQQRLQLQDIPRQYLVVTWENIRLAYWITYYGSWDITAGQGVHGQCLPLTDPFSVDHAKGILYLKGDKEPIPLASMDTLIQGGRNHEDFPGPGGRLVVSKVADQAFLMDELCYQSMMVRLLIAPPEDPQLKGLFRIVFEGYPLVRIYEAL